MNIYICISVCISIYLYICISVVLCCVVWGGGEREREGEATGAFKCSRETSEYRCVKKRSAVRDLVMELVCL